MSQLRPPKKPVPDWEKVRDEWVQAVDALVSEVEGWCKANDWPTRRIEKRLEESRLGEYRAPALVVQIDLVKLMLEPIARFVTNADGLVDLYRMPEYADTASVFRRHGRWEFVATVTLPDDAAQPDSDVGAAVGAFDRAAFTQLVQLLK